MFGEDGFDEARFGIHTTRQELGAKPTTVLSERSVGCDSILRFGRRDGLIIGKIEQLFGEDGVVGEDANRIIINMKAVSGGFDNDGFFGIGDDPVKLTQGELGAEVVIIEAHIGEFGAGFGDTGAGAENVGNELVRRDIIAALGFIKIDGIISEAKTGDAEPLIIHRVVVERVVIAIAIRDDIGDANDGMVVSESGEGLEMKRKIVGCDGDGLVVGIVEVEIATEISIFSLING